MQKILFNKLLILSVLDGSKTMTRRTAYDGEIANPNTGWGMEGSDKDKLLLVDGNIIVAKSRYHIGEIVAVARSYKDIADGKSWINGERMGIAVKHAMSLPGWNNSMFVLADLMPHQIRITDIKVERLQDISDEDCIKEGIIKTEVGDYNCVDSAFFKNPRDAFAMLIDEVSGKGTWERNPWVFAYSFELACASFAQRQ